MSLRIGIVGLGDVAETYLSNLRLFRDLEVVACAGRNQQRLAERAASHGLEPMTVDALLARADIDLILNLTPVAAHADVSRDALSAGKHVYSEKPLTEDLESALALADLATRRGVRLGAAPDIAMGFALRRARALIDAGEIGEPVLAIVSAMSAGMEGWHPNPAQFYGPHGGPARDLGPYYLSALNYLIGPVRSVSTRGRIGRNDRRSASSGETIDISSPTTVIASLELESGVLAEFTASWDAQGSALPAVEIHGTAGTLRIAVPDWYAGTVEVIRADAAPARYAPDPAHLPAVARSQRFPSLRGIGVAEMARAIQLERPHLFDHHWALHISATIEAMELSMTTGQSELVSRPLPRPHPVAEALYDDLIEAGPDR